MNVFVLILQQPGRNRNVQNIRTYTGFSGPARLPIPRAAEKSNPHSPKYNKCSESGASNACFYIDFEEMRVSISISEK